MTHAPLPTRSVRQLLRSKGFEVWSIRPEVSVFEALRIMETRNVGALPVVKEGRLVGILTERDYARKVILQGRSSRKALVRDIMTPDVVTVTLSDTAEKCMTIMTARRVRHLPVLEGGKLAGIVSVGDLLKSIISEQHHVIRQLEGYIKGG